MIFIEEALESLAELDTRFLALEERPDDRESLAAIFRVMHTIKGNSAFFGLMRVKKLAHQMEDLMALMREGRVAAGPKHIKVMLRGLDALRSMLCSVQSGGAEGAGFAKDAYQALLGEVAGLCTEGGKAGNPIACVIEELDAILAGPVDFQVMRERLKALRAGLQDLEAPNKLDDGVARDASPDPKTELRRILERPFDDQMPEPDARRVNELLAALRESADGAAGEVLERLRGEHDRLIAEVGFTDFLAQGLLSGLAELEALAQGAQDGPGPEAPEPEGPEVDSAEEGSSDRKRRDAVARSMRVDESKIDEFLDYVGELIIVREMFVNVGTRLRETAESSSLSAEYQRALEAFTLLSHSLQYSIMEIRKVPVKAALQKVPRLARDLASARSKQVRVRIVGEEVPIDKSLLEALEGPLTHMIRNAVDHGIEAPSEREKAGKDPTGTLSVSAFEDPDHVRLEVTDDGGGINVDKLKAKATACGIITQVHAQRMGDDEARNLLFAAGLSTAAEVTDISGRGVGMDVVRRNVVDLGGEITIESELGKGTTFCLVLPKAVTVQILDGFLVRVAGHRFVLPLGTIRESFRPDATHVVTVAERGEFISRRGQVFPLVRFGDVLRLGGSRTAPEQAIVVSVDLGAGASAGLLVDEVLGVQQVVLREVHGIQDQSSPFSGGAVLGDGRVAMVVDVDHLGGLV